ncbi:YxcD family protein [Scopulibacillus cellulosilyticus]|uniref:YxcD family protein n=1 Tax=Scopulibacillus cellulosilyticus TaxID=2665665 RepID=A0ABW2PST0_9BACL
MEKIMISEQDIINALCLFLADKKQISPEEVQVELLYDDDYGFSAEAYVNDRKQVLITANIIEAIRFWLETETDIDPIQAGLELELDDEEGIIAYVK